MSDGFAVYEIMRNGRREVIRFFVNEDDEFDMTEVELEAANIIDGGYCSTGNGEPGFYVDPYKAAESILAEHYGYAKMVEAHYEWKPGIVY